MIKILIVYRITTYQSSKVYDLPKAFRLSFISLFDLCKGKDWSVDMFMLNHYKFEPDIPLQFGWIYESMPSFLEIARTVAKAGNYDYLFITEPDIILPENCLINLVETKADIAVGIYPERPSKIGDWFNREGQPPNGWLVCMPWNRNRGAEKAVAQRKTFKLTGCAGFGCVLLNRESLDKISFPQRDTAGNGPDFGFYQKAREQNLNILCNPNIRCKHIELDGTIIEGPE